MTHEPRGVAAVLWGDVTALATEIDHKREAIATAERKIVSLRDELDDLMMRSLETRVAAQMIEKAGIKAERRGADWHVSVEHGLAAPETASEEVS
jgi:hypothetical protein